MDTIVLIPGYMCDQNMWSNQLDILKKKYKVIIPQLNIGDSIEKFKIILSNYFQKNFQ